MVPDGFCAVIIGVGGSGQGLKMAVSRTLLSVITAYLLTLIIHTEAHVALTFPPARKYDLDFLDNSRTKGPCGMPKGKISFFL